MIRQRRKFPTFAVILLALGIIWLLNELKIINININIWIPIIVIIIALGMIINRYLIE